MDTSDSEYFESADEEIYSDPDTSKSDKLTSEVQKDLINLNLEDNSTQEQELKVDDVDIIKVESVGDSILVDNVSKNNNVNVENEKISEINVQVPVVDNSDCENNKKCENKHENSDKDIPEAVEEENMWENDDWEPVNCEKDDNPKVPEEIDHVSTKNVGKEDNMWNNDDWEPFEEVQPQKQQDLVEPTWSSWGNWGGVTSIFSTASQGVSTLTQGLSNVLETSIGIPDPKELAKLDREQEILIQQSTEEESESTSNKGFGFGNLSNFVSGVSQFVESTGSKVITGGLDTLETIGKKTMEVLQEGDPGLKNKRALLNLDKNKPILSQILREAKEKAETENKQRLTKKKLNYETLFDDYHGLVHLEALEMLSKQCDITLQTLCEEAVGDQLRDLQETMEQIKELCELPEEDDEETTFNDIKDKIQSAVEEIKVPISYSKLLLLWEETDAWLRDVKLEFCQEDEIYQEALRVLAQLTALAVEQFHKCGELLLIKDHRSTVDEADCLVQLTTALTGLIGLAAARFTDKLNAKFTSTTSTGDKETVNSLITNVFFEAGNSSSYIQDAFQLLVPVLQAGAMS